MLVLAGQPAASASVPAELRGHTRAHAPFYDLSFALATSRAPLDPGFWVGFGMDDQGQGYAAWVGRTLVKLFERRHGRSRELARTPLGKGYWNAAERTLRLAIRPRRVFLYIDDHRLLQARADEPPGDYMGVLGIAKTALAGEPRVHKRAAPRFTDDFSSPKTVAEAWSVQAGQWQLEAPVDPLIALNENTPMYSLYTARGERSAATTGHDWWDFYAAEVTCRIRASTECGLMLYWQDAANHAAWVLHKQKGRCGARLQWVRQGKAHRMDARGSFDASQWHRLRVEALDNRVWAYVDGRLAVAGQGLGLQRGKVGLCAAGPGAAFDDVVVEPFDAMMLAARDGCPLPRAWPGVRVRAWIDPAQPVGVSLQDRSRKLEWEAKPKEQRMALCLTDKGSPTPKRLGSEPLGPAPADIDLAAFRGVVRAAVAGKPAYHWRAEEFSPTLAAVVGGATWARAEPWEPKPALVHEDRFDSRTTRSKLDARARPVIGQTLMPTQGHWSISLDGQGQGRLCTRGQGAASLAYAKPCPGDVRVGVDVLSMAQGVALKIASAAYTARLEPGARGHRLSLLRGSKVVAEKSLQLSADRLPSRITLERDGHYIVAELDGTHRVVWRDPQPQLGEQVSLASLGGQCSFDNLRIENLTALHYPFTHISPDWREASGGFMLHSGLSCIPWSYWLTADGRSTPAVLWHRDKLPADLAVQFDVSEITIGTDDPDVTHYHFPYHDVTLALCANGSDPQSGYAIEIGADRGRCARVRKRGKVLWETREFTITMGGHCNTPRQVEVYVRKSGPRLTVTLNGSTLADLHDPDPLPGGSLALVVKDCRANFSDVLIIPEIDRAKGQKATAHTRPAR